MQNKQQQQKRNDNDKRREKKFSNDNQQPFSLWIEKIQKLSYSICLSWCDSKQKLILWSRKSINLDSLCECGCQIGVQIYRIWLKNRLKRSNFYGRCTWISASANSHSHSHSFVGFVGEAREKIKLRSFALKQQQQQQQWQRGNGNSNSKGAHFKSIT